MLRVFIGSSLLPALVLAFACPAVTQAQPSRVFLTSTNSTGNLGGLAAADQICEERAAAGSLGGGPWVAWLSTSTTDAVDRMTPTLGPFVRAVTGLTIATDIEDLTDGTLCNSIEQDEFGSGWVHFAWTGTLSDGTLGGGTCNDWTAGSPPFSATYGFNPEADETWTDNGETLCSFELNLYCFEVPQATGAIFSDGFESANSCSWTWTEPFAGHPCAGFDYSVDSLTVSFLNQSTGDPPLTYQWDFGDGSPPSDEKNPVHEYGSPDDYVVSLLVTNPSGSDQVTKIVSICQI